MANITVADVMDWLEYFEAEAEVTGTTHGSELTVWPGGSLGHEWYDFPDVPE